MTAREVLRVCSLKLSNDVAIGDDDNGDCVVLDRYFRRLADVGAAAPRLDEGEREEGDGLEGKEEVEKTNPSLSAS